MKQEGGVRRLGLEPAFDVRATPFGAYDAAIIAAIRKRWYDLLENRSFSASYSGKVIVEFRLNSDGRVSDMRVSENGVTEILGLFCQRAVQDPAPFAPWPADLRRLVGKEYREVRFTFYYN
jgi:outer membrane biosynthesis protein TonB